jgi:hypothetical protein
LYIDRLSFFVLVASFGTWTYVVEVLSFAADSLWLEYAVLRVPELVLATFLSSTDMRASATSTDTRVFNLLRNHDDLAVSVLEGAVFRNRVGSRFKFCWGHDLITLLKCFK